MFARSKLMGVTSASRFKSAKSCAGYSSSVCCFSSRLQRAWQTYPTEDGSSPVLRSHCRRRTVQTEQRTVSRQKRFTKVSQFLSAKLSSRSGRIVAIPDESTPSARITFRFALDSEEKKEKHLQQAWMLAFKLYADDKSMQINTFR